VRLSGAELQSLRNDLSQVKDMLATALSESAESQAESSGLF
jgi:hypothetical protein